MLDVFFQICRDDYVGGDDAGSKGKLIHEICKSLTKLKQEYNLQGVGYKTDTPDELYSKYIGIVAGLPDDATIWSVNLCSTYYSALHNNLKDKMEESDFCMLQLNNMGTKALQIEGLRTVRTSAVTSYKDLNDEEKRIRRIFLQLQNRRQPRGDAHQYNGHQGGDQTHGDLYFSSYSQAEATLSKYGGGGTSGGTTDTHVHEGADGKKYPFDPNEPAYVSKFPLGWTGCYKCGKEDHWKREFCPEGNNQDQKLKEIFHKELKCHKPAFRKPAYAPRVSEPKILSVLLPQYLFCVIRITSCWTCVIQLYSR